MDLYCCIYECLLDVSIHVIPGKKMDLGLLKQIILDSAIIQPFGMFVHQGFLLVVQLDILPNLNAEQIYSTGNVNTLHQIYISVFGLITWELHNRVPFGNIHLRDTLAVSFPNGGW